MKAQAAECCGEAVGKRDETWRGWKGGAPQESIQEGTRTEDYTTSDAGTSDNFCRSRPDTLVNTSHHNGEEYYPR
jgi:hypothetical protein